MISGVSDMKKTEPFDEEVQRICTEVMSNIFEEKAKDLVIQLLREENKQLKKKLDEYDKKH